MFETTESERYSRQITLPEIGESGQQKIKSARVLVIGAGGLGCPALQYLAAAGVGTLGIADDDKVALSNLHRQPLYRTEDVGQPKVQCAARRLAELNPGITIQGFEQRITTRNALEIIAGFDIVLDGTDNFETRYLINDACVLLGKPLVFGAVLRFEGQVAVFNQPGNEPAANYRDLFPQPPEPGEVPGCAEAGVLGVLPGIIGALQAGETLKLITGAGQPLTNRLLSYDARNNRFLEVRIEHRAATDSLIPQDAVTFKNTDYAWLCGLDDLGFEIDCPSLEKLLTEPQVRLIDLREPGESPEFNALPTQKIGLPLLEQSLQTNPAATVVLLCQSGVRSLQAAKRLRRRFGSALKVHSLRGGVWSWNAYRNKR